MNNQKKNNYCCSEKQEALCKCAKSCGCEEKCNCGERCECNTKK